MDQVYPQTRRVSVYRVGIKQETSTKVELSRVHSFQFREVPDFVVSPAADPSTCMVQWLCLAPL